MKVRPIIVVLGTLFAATLAALVVMAIAFDPYRVVSEANEPALHRGDRVLARAWGLDGVGRGDIVMYRDPYEDRTLVHRIVAVGGDKIEAVDGRLVVNGRPSEIAAHGETIGVDPQTVPAGRVFLMGDNRQNSRDSRYFGPIARSDIEARLVAKRSPDRLLLLTAGLLALVTLAVVALFGTERREQDEKVQFRDLRRRENWDDPWRDDSGEDVP